MTTLSHSTVQGPRSKVEGLDFRPSTFDLSTFIPIHEAAALLAEPLRTIRHRAATQWVKLGLAELRPPPSGRGKPIWWIHRSVDPRLDRCPDRPTREDQVRESLLTRHPHHLVERAYRKSFWLQEWRKRCAFPRVADETQLSIAAAIVAEAKAAEDESFRIGLRSLQLWHKAYNELDDYGQIRGIEGLVDNYGGSGEQAPTPTRSQEAIDFFYRVYYSQAKQTLQTCHDATVLEARRKHWLWPESYAATVRWLKKHENRAESCLHREGHGEYSHRHMQHLEIDYTALEPGARYVLDHSQADFWCTYGTRQIRPWLTGIIDARSRVLVGHHWGPTPHQDAIIAAMRMAFRDWAIPGKVHIDRGKDYTSELITGVTKAKARQYRHELGPGWRKALRHQADVFWHGILGELGIDVAEATPYHPWAKGLIERFFSTVHDQFDKTFVTYTGRSTETRPECSQRLRQGPDVPTLDTVRERFADYVELYHRRAHRGIDGLAPIAVWSTATRLRKAVESELLALMQARGVYRVQANGVAFRIAGTTLSYGATSARLRAHAGRDVFITLDPKECGCCYAYTADRSSRKFIDRLECNERVPVDTPVDELREAIRSLRHRNKQFNSAQAEAPHRMNSAAREVQSLRRQQLAELRATGTDDARPDPNIAVVQTGFEGASKRIGTGPSAPRRDRKACDLQAAAAALGYGHGLSESTEIDPPRATMDMLAAVSGFNTDSSQDADDESRGTDADRPRPDLLSLIAGDRHE